MHIQMTSRDRTWTKICRTAVFSVACVTLLLSDCKQLKTEECWGKREGSFTSTCKTFASNNLERGTHTICKIFGFLFSFVPKYAPASLISGKAPFIVFVV